MTLAPLLLALSFWIPAQVMIAAIPAVLGDDFGGRRCGPGGGCGSKDDDDFFGCDYDWWFPRCVASSVFHQALMLTGVCSR